MKLYIHQFTDWPNFYWNSNEIISLLSLVRNTQGRLMGRMESLGYESRNEAQLDTLTLDVIKSSEIEGEFLDQSQVRSSIARRLSLEIAGSVESDRKIDGVVEMMLDATQHYDLPLTKERLFDWHAALFPTGRSGMHKITVAAWRNDEYGPMHVISGSMGNPTIHFQAPDAALIEQEMITFLNWFNTKTSLDIVLKAAVAHLWFVTIHPFEDGNGRITRALTDLLLAQSDNSTQRYYSVSAQIRLQRNEYYEQLEKAQKGTLDCTQWMKWFLECVLHALESSESVLKKVLFKADFWRQHSKVVFNERQIKLLNKLLDGFDGKLTSSKWAKIAKCSKDTAIRDINDLVQKNVLQRESAGGRSTNYELVKFSE